MRISDWSSDVCSSDLEVDAVIGAALGDQALRAVERIDAELAPAALLHQLFLELHVEEVVPRIALVTAKIERARQADRQVGVDLDQAVIAALVIIIAAPALVRHEFEAEALAFGHRDVHRAPPAAAPDRGAEGDRKRV